MKVQTHFELKQPLRREYIIQGENIGGKESGQVVTYSWYCTVFFTSSSNINSKIRFEVSVQLTAKLGLIILLSEDYLLIRSSIVLSQHKNKWLTTQAFLVLYEKNSVIITWLDCILSMNSKKK
jgi:hypothetical protein